MKFTNLKVTIPSEKREAVNETLLMLIDTGDMQGIIPEEVFNSYTGAGGLHGLKRSDFRNMHEFTEAKKEIEQGQFFTPAAIAQQMSELIDLKGHETIADLTCGSGIFCNYFAENNFYGCEIDSKAVKIAKFLYPAANFSLSDIRYYNPLIKFDFIIGNPPFNLDIDGQKSQDYFFSKASQLLRPAGIILVIVPASFCADQFDNKREIEGIEDNYSFMFQSELPLDAFKQLGVTSFATKIMGWQKKSDSITAKAYTPVNNTWPEAVTIFNEHKEVARKLKIKANSEMTNEEAEFNYKANKYLYEIKTQAPLKKYYAKALEHIAKYKNQVCPDNMKMDEWVRSYRITPQSVLSYLKRTVKKQSYKQIDKIRIVKTTYGFKAKAYSDKAKHTLSKEFPEKNWSFNEIICNDINIDILPKEIRKYKALIERKKKAYYNQIAAFTTLTADPHTQNYVDTFKWITKGNECRFNEIQRNDLGKMLMKKYGILNWQQGSGKTSAAYAWCKHQPQKKNFIVSGALAINNTWQKFLRVKGEKFVMVESIADLAKIESVNYVLISHYYLIKLEINVKNLIKRYSGKVNMVLDESDEITNHLAKRTKAIQSCFRRVTRKLETTGTTTRNNISELYTQLELLYNNSINMICTCEFKYEEDKEEGKIYKQDNEYYKKPFPARYGNRIFRQCFNPAKTTVFGIQKHNQDLYNEKELRDIVESTIITRKFKEIAGDKYRVVNHTCHQSAVEKVVYSRIITEFHAIVYQHFQNTGNSRKESHLKLIRQMQLLIKATSMPQSFSDYVGNNAPNKSLDIFQEVAQEPGRIAIGCITTDAMDYYVDQIKKRFPARPVYMICGDVSFKKRETIIDQFQASNTGILICTQQSLKSSVNIPKCNLVFIEALQWNIPTIEQFYFRFIRYDSPGITTVKFFNYAGTIEANLLALLMSKEKLNDFIKTLTYRDNDDMYAEFGLDTNILNMLMTKTYDEEGHMQLNWGKSESII